ncbi:MAG: hypothetical protein EBY80_15770 [Actinobacteria bacterium]|nr:hypothetical protein [Actinomycetota bacterium]
MLKRTAADPKVVDASFDTTNYIGAVKDAGDTWYAGWTCNSTTANFGSSGSACSTLPRIAPSIAGTPSGPAII